MKHTSSWALRRVLKSLGRYLPLLLVSLLLAAASVACTLYIPILVGDAIDRIVGPGQVDFAAVGSLAVKIAVLAGLTAILQWVMTAIHNRVCFCVTRDVRRQAFSHLQRLPLSYLDSHPSGDTLSRMIADVDQFADGLLMGFTQLFTGVLTIVGTLGFMLSISWKITLVVVLLTPLSLLVAKFIAGHTYSMFQLQSRARGEQTALIGEQLNGQRVVQAFSHEAESLRQFDEINDRLTAHTMRATFFSSMTNPSTRIIYNIIYACVGFTGALSAVAGAITVGGLSCFLSYANQYAKPFNEITGVITELQNALACAARVFALIDEPAETPDAADAKTLEAVSGSVELQNVAFSYTPEQHLIEDLNLSVKPGQRIAIVGPTGCGKTTLINLLMRFYDVKDGSISVDGSEIRSVTRESLRRQYGMVLQDTWLKTASVRENIRLAKPDATDAEVAAAVRALLILRRAVHAVVESCQLLDHLRIVAHADVKGVVGVFKREGPLELSGLDAELLPARPLQGGILDVGGAVHLELQAIIEVAEHRTADIQTHQTEVEAVLRDTLCLTAVPSILADDVAAEFDGCLRQLGPFFQTPAIGRLSLQEGLGV